MRTYQRPGELGTKAIARYGSANTPTCKPRGEVTGSASQAVSGLTSVERANISPISFASVSQATDRRRRVPDLQPTWPGCTGASLAPNVIGYILALFLFLYFLKLFFTEIYFRFHNLQVYTPTARQGGGRGPRGGRPPADPLPDGRGLHYHLKIFSTSFV